MEPFGEDAGLFRLHGVDIEAFIQAYKAAPNRKKRNTLQADLLTVEG